MPENRDKIPQELKQEIFARIKPIIARELNISEDKIKLETNIAEDLVADSLDATELIIALEEEFNIEISDEDSDKMKTIEDIVLYLAARGIN